MFDGKNLSEILEVIWMVIVIVNFFVSIYWVERVIKLCKECLIILSNKVVIIEIELI